MTRIAHRLPTHEIELAKRYRQEFLDASDFGWEFSLHGDSFVQNGMSFPALLNGRARSILGGAALPNRPRYTREEIASRHRYARGDDDPRIVRDVERMMQRSIDSGVEFRMRVTRDSTPPHAPKRSVRRTDKRIEKSFEARAILETALGSRMTLMDFVELLDVTSAPVYLRGVDINYYATKGPKKVIRISGRYEHLASFDPFLGTAPGIENSITLIIDRGRVSIGARNIDVSEYGRGHGFGARSLLALALFAKRHRVKSWEDAVVNDGIFAWPTLGGELTDDGYRRTMGLLEEVWELVRLGSIDIENIEPRVDKIAEVEVWDSDIEERELFMGALEHMLERAGRDFGELEGMREPYRVGSLALQAASLSVLYRTDRLLDHLLHEYFPKRILRRKIISLNEGSTNSHRNFVEAYRRGLTERRVLSELDGRGAQETRILMPDMDKAMSIPGWLIQARMARLAAPGEFSIPVGDGSVAGALNFIGREHAGRLPTPVAFHAINLALRTSMAPNQIHLPTSPLLRPTPRAVI